MKYSGYELVPSDVQEKLLKEYESLVLVED
jgi:hypothetical protein